MIWSLPYTVKIGNKEYEIRDRCDYRVVLDVIRALRGTDLEPQERIGYALYIFYGDATSGCDDPVALYDEMIKIINGGESEEQGGGNKPRLMDWEYDFKHIAPPVSRVLGYDVRDPDRFTHWYSFLGAYAEIGGECMFATIVSIRSKRAKGKKLEKWEEEFFREHRKDIILPQIITADEQEILDSQW